MRREYTRIECINGKTGAGDQIGQGLGGSSRETLIIVMIATSTAFLETFKAVENDLERRIETNMERLLKRSLITLLVKLPPGNMDCVLHGPVSWLLVDFATSKMVES